MKPTTSFTHGYAASISDVVSKKPPPNIFKTITYTSDFHSQGYARLVDIPGHERLRGRFVDEYKNSARGAVFVVDSLTLQKDVRDVAE